MKHFSRTEDFTTEDYEEIFRRTEIFEEGLKKGENFVHLCPGKVISTMFFQESTRTSASLQAAMVKLGGGWFGIAGIKGTYLESGEEDLEDTLHGVAPLCDIMGIRHKDLNLAELAESGFRVPLINGMCGSEEHSIAGALFPYIAKRKFNKLNGLKIGLYGMGKSSRPIKAAAKVFSRFGVEFFEDSVIPEFRLPEHIRKVIAENGSTIKEDKLENFIDKVDMLFVIEGLPQAGEDENLVNKFNEVFVPFSSKDLAKMKDDAIVDVGEPRATTDGRLVALKEVDNSPKLVGKKLLEGLVYGNMAIITYLLGVDVK